MVLNGSEILLECLLEQGVDTVFGYPGGAVLYIYDALYKYKNKIRHVLTSHEQGASHAADGYARTTGKTGVVIATSGPGATNLVTGLATAYMDSIPLIAVTGNVSTPLLGLDSFKEVDITGITMPITKHNYIVKDILRLADTVREAFYTANADRKGPVLIDIPKDVSAMECEYTPRNPKPFAFTPIDKMPLETAAGMINRSQRPFIYAGGGVTSSEAREELAQLAELADAPVSLSLMGQCAFDNSNPRYTGMLGMHGTKTSSSALCDCDLAIVIGSRFSDRVTCGIDGFLSAVGDAEILQIEIDPAEIDKNIKTHCAVSGDIKTILSALNKMITKRVHSDWMNLIGEWKKEFPLHQSSGGGDFTPEFVLKTLEELTDGKAILPTEVGQHQMWAAQFYDFKLPRSFASSGGLGTMGFGLGAAIGSKIGNPNRTVINIAGDGSFYMNMNELSTLAKYNIPVIELLFNNGVLGMVRQWQKLFYGRRFSQTTIGKNTDFETLARAMGIEAFTIREKADVRLVLESALSLNAPSLINCLIDKDINVLPMVPAGGSIAEPILEITDN